MALLGIDIGTSGTKALVIDERGRVLGAHTVAHSLQTPRPGWTQQDPEEWWAAARKGVAGAVRKARLRGAEISAVGLSGQMHGSVFLDKRGKVLRPALLWNDQRTHCQSLEILRRAGGEHRMLQLAGNLPLTGYTAPKILWLREHEPRLYTRLAHILLPKDYIRYRMTGDLATDVGDGGGMCLMDVRKRTWSQELLRLLDIDPTLLPKLCESPEITGALGAGGAKVLGLRAGTPVVAGSGDVMTGAVGTGIVEPGIVGAALGTSGVVCAHSERLALDHQAGQVGRVASMCHAVPGAYLVYGCMLSAGGSLQWYAQTLRVADREKAKKAGKSVYELLMREAARAPAGCEGLLFLPYLTGERCPCADPHARGGWIGATRRTDSAMLVRSVIEGVTFNMNAILRIIRDEMGVEVRQVRATGGGARSRLWRQIQADVYSAPVAAMSTEEGAAYGAALLAAVGAGVFASVPEACQATLKPTQALEPNPKAAAVYAHQQAVFDRMYPSLRERFAEIAELSGTA